MLTLEPGTFVFHPNHGHCRVLGQREEVLLRIPTQVLELVKPGKDLKNPDKDAVTFRLPLTGPAHLRLRALEQKGDILAKLEILKTPAEIKDLDDKERLDEQKQILSDGKFEGLIGLFRDLHKLQKVGNFTTPDRKAMEQAKEWILQEMILVLGITRLEARKMVEEAVKQSIKAKAKKG